MFHVEHQDAECSTWNTWFGQARVTVRVARLPLTPTPARARLEGNGCHPPRPGARAGSVLFTDTSCVEFQEGRQSTGNRFSISSRAPGKLRLRR